MVVWRGIFYWLYPLEIPTSLPLLYSPSLLSSPRPPLSSPPLTLSSPFLLTHILNQTTLSMLLKTKKTPRKRGSPRERLRCGTCNHASQGVEDYFSGRTIIRFKHCSFGSLQNSCIQGDIYVSAGTRIYRHLRRYIYLAF